MILLVPRTGLSRRRLTRALGTLVALLVVSVLPPREAHAAADRWQVTETGAARVCTAGEASCVTVHCAEGRLHLGFSTTAEPMAGTRLLAPIRIDRLHVTMLDGVWRDDPWTPGRRYAGMAVDPGSAVISRLASGNRLDIHRGHILPLRGSAQAIEQVMRACG